jgi:RNA polymerase sigma-70 factor (ECF subfamily)
MDQEFPPYEQSEGRHNVSSDKHVPKELTLALSKPDHRLAVGILMREYGDIVYSYCRRLLRDQHAAEDAHQTIFVLAYQHMGRLQQPSKVREWLFSIVHNHCMSELRKRKLEAQYFSARDPPLEAPSLDALPDEREDLPYAIKSLNECIKRLTPEARYTLLLRYQEERPLTYEEMGRICRERPTTLQMRVARAMLLLRQCLEGKGVML